MASREGCVIAISGAEDFITDGTREYRVRNGHPLMTRVTGLGCGLSAVVGAFCAVGKGDMTASTAAAFGVYGLCGEIAVKISDKPAGFQNAFIDTLYSVDDKDIQAGLRVAEKI
jgi:hydroxyethylthiazole kinase